MTTKSKYWFVSLEKLQGTEGAKLKLADSELLETDQLLETGSPLTISLESFFVKSNHDEGKSGNDLLVRSWTKYGSEPRIETVNFFAKDVPDSFVGENLNMEHIFSTRDYDEENRIRLELEITEIDKGLDINKSMSNDLEEVANTFGAVFPVILPFVSAASSLLGDLEKLFSKNLENKQVLHSALDLYGQGSCETLLRCGAYIFFHEEVEGVMYKLRELKLEPVSDQIKQPIHDYIVVKVVPNFIKSGNKDELLASQQLAAVLSQLDEGEKNDNSKKDRHLEFLQETLKKAIKLKDIDYYYELSRKKNRGEQLTESQFKRMNEIAEELRDYIPPLS
jgi:hypothetical protein